MQRLHFATVGSVDDGKSTLIGRLLYDSKSIFEDQLEHIEAVSKRQVDVVIAAALADGFNVLELVFENALRVVKQTADQG